tara:strand:- start:39 stop:1385 length:1347 start_codon:yes stop_codon:yes gene_type:complete
MAGWKRLAKATADGTSSTLSVSFDANDVIRLQIYAENTSGAGNFQIRFNNDTTANRHKTRRVYDGAGTSGNRYNDYSNTKFISYSATSALQSYMIIDVHNIDNEEHLVMGNCVESGATGAGSTGVPHTVNWMGKYTEKTPQVTSVQLITNSNNLNDKSYIIVLTTADDVVTDEKTTLTNVPIGTQYRETDTRKIYRNTIPFKDNCIAYYNFDSTSGGLVNQATTANGFTSGLGSAADGTISGATLDTTNKKLGSGCYNFDGSNDKVQTSDCSALNGATAFSISLWKNNSSTPSKSEAFINIGSDNTNNQFRMIVGGNYTTIEMWLNAVESSSKISVDCDGNGWIHYVVVWDSTQTGDSNKFKLYKNGSAQSLSFQGSNNAGDSAIQTISGGTPIIIGSLASAGVEYDGLIDDLGIWNKALSSDEISDLYNSGTGKTVDTITWKERGTA